ncbi:MAG: hypothetical protein ACOX6D_06900 [Thermoguttaceae bacterium]|jgi:hypothetical protein
MRNWLKTSAVLLFAAGTSVLSAADTSSSSRAVSPRTERESRLLSAPEFTSSQSPDLADTEESFKADGTEGSLTVSDHDYRDFVTREEFERAVSGLAWKKGPFTITPYGFLWADIAWNSSRSATDGCCLYSLSDAVDDSQGASVDARMSRIGAMINGPGFPGNPCWKMRGVLEADFEGQVNSTRNRGQLQLRKAFVELNNEHADLRFLFGQDWDIISPLAPQMLNYVPAGFAGNIGYRRCQFRVDKGFRFSADCRILWQLAIVDSYGADYNSTSGVASQSGGWPIIEGRYAVTLGKCSRPEGPITLGVSAHVGEETYRFSPIGGTYASTSELEHVQTWSVSFDADVPITKKISFLSEGFYGCDLSSFMGGINQGVDLYRRDGIRDCGGWAAFRTEITDKLTNNIGYGIDKPNEDDLQGTTVASGGKSSFRTRNELFFTNLLYQWNKALMTGIEFGYWRTDWQQSDVSSSDVQYIDMDRGKTFRIDCAVQYLF